MSAEFKPMAQDEREFYSGPVHGPSERAKRME